MADYGGMIRESDIGGLMVSPILGCAIGQRRVFIDYEGSLHVNLHRAWMCYRAVNIASTGPRPVVSAGFFRHIDALGFAQYCCCHCCSVLWARFQIAGLLMRYLSIVRWQPWSFFASLRPSELEVFSRLHLASCDSFSKGPKSSAREGPIINYTGNTPIL